MMKRILLFLMILTGAAWSQCIPPFAAGTPDPRAWVGTYSSGSTYALCDTAFYSNSAYVSIQASNTGHQPDISGTWWTLVYSAPVNLQSTDNLRGSHIALDYNLAWLRVNSVSVSPNGSCPGVASGTFNSVSLAFTDTGSCTLFTFTLTDNVAIGSGPLGNVTAMTLTGMVTGKVYVFEITQSSTTATTMAWSANMVGAAPVTTALSKISYTVASYDGTNMNVLSQSSNDTNGFFQLPTRGTLASQSGVVGCWSDMTTTTLKCVDAGANIYAMPMVLPITASAVNIPLDVLGNPTGFPMDNDTTTGTAAGYLVKQNAAGKAITAATTDTSRIIGICVTNCSVTGTALIAKNGYGNCMFDGAGAINDYVQISATAAGRCHSAGASKPATGEIIGMIVQSTTSSGVVGRILFGIQEQ